jgi:hypothetical protein
MASADKLFLTFLKTSRMQIPVVWDMAPCISVYTYQSFGKYFCLHPHSNPSRANLPRKWRQQASPERFIHIYNCTQLSGPEQWKFYEDGCENLKSRTSVVLALVVCNFLLVCDMRVNDSKTYLRFYSNLLPVGFVSTTRGDYRFRAWIKTHNHCQVCGSYF